MLQRGPTGAQMLREVDRFDGWITETGQIVKIIKLQRVKERARLYRYQTLDGAHVRPIDGVTFEIERVGIARRLEGKRKRP